MTLPSKGSAVGELSVETATKGVPTWRHPGGKLVELGSHTLKQAELLAILIGSGVAGRPALAIANAILDEYVGLHEMHRRATIDDLANIPGLGRRKAARILAAIELGRRLRRLQTPPKAAVKTEADLFSSLAPTPRPKPQPQGPTDAELLAAIIGSGIRGHPPKVIAEDLLARFGSFLGLFGQDMGDFLEIKGLNSVKIIRVAAALEVAKRLANALS
jgi:DNA repair protein RadC